MAKAHTRRFKRWLQRLTKKGQRVFVVTAIMLLGIGVITMITQSRSSRIDPIAYASLLHVIAEGESNGNYNAYYGNAKNTEITFTDMSVNEVLKWQKDFVASGQPSSAVGKYQIVRSTLESLVVQLGLDRNQKFNESLQDQMAIALLERRGSESYVNDKLSRDEFAASIAKEWAALPKIIGDEPHKSYYEDDGLNKSRIAISDVYAALDRLKAMPQLH